MMRRPSNELLEHQNVQPLIDLNVRTKNHISIKHFSKRWLFLSIGFVLTIDKKVDWSGRCETPAGAAGQVRPHRRLAPRRLTARPAESEHPEAEINHFSR